MIKKEIGEAAENQEYKNEMLESLKKVLRERQLRTSKRSSAFCSLDCLGGMIEDIYK